MAKKFPVHLQYIRSEQPKRFWEKDMDSYGGPDGDLEVTELNWDFTDDGWLIEVDGVLSTEHDDMSNEEAQDLAHTLFWGLHRAIYPNVWLTPAESWPYEENPTASLTAKKLKTKLMR